MDQGGQGMIQEVLGLARADAGHLRAPGQLAPAPDRVDQDTTHYSQTREGKGGDLHSLKLLLGADFQIGQNEWVSLSLAAFAKPVGGAVYML